VVTKWADIQVDTRDSHIILGLKELEALSFPLVHTHVQFAHCYKDQAGWQEVLSRFPRGRGTLLDLEFLVDSTGRRVAAFGFHAGFAGSALAIKTWAHQQQHGSTPLEGVDAFTEGRGYYEDENQMLAQLRHDLDMGSKAAGRLPKVLVMGALGRCGRGAVELCEKAGIPPDNIVRWDLAETKDRHGPYMEIVEVDIFVNCVGPPRLRCASWLIACRSTSRHQYRRS